MTASEWNDAPGKYEDEADYFEDPDGNIDWRIRKRHATRVRGGRIDEKSGICRRDYDCGCPGTAIDAGSCRVSGARVCATHREWCSVCGLPVCQRHRTVVNGLPICHSCFRTDTSPTWVLYLAIALFGVLFILYLTGG